MVKFLKCSKCPYSEQTYDIPGFTEHYAEYHIGSDFYLYSCSYCRQHFASAFLARQHMGSCENSFVVQVYSRAIDEIPLCNYQVLNKALENAVIDAINDAASKEVGNLSPLTSGSSTSAYSSGFHEAPYGDRDYVGDDNSRYTVNNSNNTSMEIDLDRRLTLQEEPENRRDLSPVRFPDHRHGERSNGRLRRSRSRDRSSRRYRVERRERSSSRRRGRYVNPYIRPNQRRPARSPAPLPRIREAIAAPVVDMAVDNRGRPPNLLYLDVSAPQRSPYIVPPVPAPYYRNPLAPIMPIGRGLPKLNSGPKLSLRGMSVFNTKNAQTDLKIEIHSSDGSKQMFFNQKLLSEVSPYFAKVFAQPSFLQSVEKTLELRHPEIPFVDCMNYLHSPSKIPWVTRCKEVIHNGNPYHQVNNLYRAYKVLQEATDLEIQRVKQMVVHNLFLQRCNIGAINNCYSCIERVVLAIHFGIAIPEYISFTPLACSQWLTLCDEYSCAMELGEAERTIQFVRRFVPPGSYPGF